MKCKLWLLVSTMTAVGALAGCEDDERAMGDGMAGAGPGGAGAEGGSGGTAAAGTGGTTGIDGGRTSADGGSTLGLTDAEIAAIATALNEADADRAMLALERSDSLPVRTFARRILTETDRGILAQGKALDQLQIARPVENHQSRELRERGLRLLQTLREAPAGEFDTLYISAQIQAHEEMLRLLRTGLVDDADSTSMRLLLVDLQARIVRNLAIARGIASTLG